MWETTADALYHWGRVIMDYVLYGILVKNVLMLDLFHLLSSPDVNWWTGVVWIIVMFLSDSHSDGTHSHPLLRHWCSDAFLQTWWRNKLIYISDDLRRSKFSFLVNYSFKFPSIICNNVTKKHHCCDLWRSTGWWIQPSVQKCSRFPTIHCKLTNIPLNHHITSPAEIKILSYNIQKSNFMFTSRTLDFCDPCKCMIFVCQSVVSSDVIFMWSCFSLHSLS